MSSLLNINLMTIAAARIDYPAATHPPGLDVIMLFGFMAAFLTIVAVLYQGQMQTRIPLLAICVLTLSAYAFLQGSLALGFSVMALAALEVRRWWHRKTVGCSYVNLFKQQRQPSLYESHSRIQRMFGSSER